MDGMLYKREIENNEVIDLKVVPIIRALKLKTDQGVLGKGTPLARNAAGTCVPHKTYAAIDLTGVVDGANKAYTHDGSGFDGELAPRSIVVAHGEQELVDDGCGRLYGDGSGTVNYVTGVVAATFTDAPAEESGAPTIVAKSVPVGVTVRSADTSLNTAGEAKDDVVSTLVFGCVVRDRVTVGGAALTDADAALLAKINVYALY